MGILGGGKSGPDPETVRLQQEQERRLMQQEKKLRQQERDQKANEARRREAELRRRRGFGGLLSGSYSGFKLSEKDTLG